MTHPNALSERSEEIGYFDEAQKNPLILIPKEWRRQVSWLWMCYSHLLPTSMPLCASLATWAKTNGLRSEDLLPVLRMLVEPGMSSKFRFASDLLTELARLVKQAIDKRRECEKVEAMKRNNPDDTKFSDFVEAALKIGVMDKKDFEKESA